MKEVEFEQLCRSLDDVFNDFTADLNNDRIVHAELSSRGYGGGFLLTIKSGQPTKEHLSGSFCLENDPADDVVRVLIADRRMPPNAARIERLKASELTPEKIAVRLRQFVNFWLAGP